MNNPLDQYSQEITRRHAELEVLHVLKRWGMRVVQRGKRSILQQVENVDYNRHINEHQCILDQMLGCN